MCENVARGGTRKGGFVLLWFCVHDNIGISKLWGVRRSGLVLQEILGASTFAIKHCNYCFAAFLLFDKIPIFC